MKESAIPRIMLWPPVAADEPTWRGSGAQKLVDGLNVSTRPNLFSCSPNMAKDYSRATLNASDELEEFLPGDKSEPTLLVGDSPNPQVTHAGTKGTSRSKMLLSTFAFPMRVCKSLAIFWRMLVLACQALAFVLGDRDLYLAAIAVLRWSPSETVHMHEFGTIGGNANRRK
jgi:hypothetical protein